jgi:hypothetical protein
MRGKTRGEGKRFVGGMYQLVSFFLCHKEKDTSPKDTS